MLTHSQPNNAPVPVQQPVSLSDPPFPDVFNNPRPSHPDFPPLPSVTTPFPDIFRDKPTQSSVIPQPITPSTPQPIFRNQPLPVVTQQIPIRDQPIAGREQPIPVRDPPTPVRELIPIREQKIPVRKPLIPTREQPIPGSLIPVREQPKTTIENQPPPFTFFQPVSEPINPINDIVPVGPGPVPGTGTNVAPDAGRMKSHKETVVGSSILGEIAYVDVDGEEKILSYKKPAPLEPIIPAFLAPELPQPEPLLPVVPHPEEPPLFIRHHGSTVVPRLQPTPQPQPQPVHPSTQPHFSSPSPQPVSFIHHETPQSTLPHVNPTAHPAQIPSKTIQSSNPVLPLKPHPAEQFPPAPTPIHPQQTFISHNPHSIVEEHHPNPTSFNPHPIQKELPSHPTQSPFHHPTNKPHKPQPTPSPHPVHLSTPKPILPHHHPVSPSQRPVILPAFTPAPPPLNLHHHFHPHPPLRPPVPPPLYQAPFPHYSPPNHQHHPHPQHPHVPAITFLPPKVPHQLVTTVKPVLVTTSSTSLYKPHLNKHSPRPTYPTTILHSTPTSVPIHHSIVTSSPSRAPIVVTERYPSPSPIPFIWKPSGVVFTPKPFVHIHTTVVPIVVRSSPPRHTVQSSPRPSPQPRVIPQKPVPQRFTTPHPHFFTTPYPQTPYPPVKYFPTVAPYQLPSKYSFNGHALPAHVKFTRRQDKVHGFDIDIDGSSNKMSIIKPDKSDLINHQNVNGTSLL